jgi:hypothetical protein
MESKIGIAGIISRVGLGIILFGSVVYGHWFGPFRPAPWVIGILFFPLLVIVIHYYRVAYDKKRFQYSSGLASCINILIFLTLYLTHVYEPPLSYLSDSVLIFYGVSMLLAAIRGYGGCEVLAISNWLLKRDDRIGCMLFSPFDYLDKIFFLRRTKES